MDSVVSSDLIAQFFGAILGFTLLLIVLSKVFGLLAGFAVRSRAQRVMFGSAVAVLCSAALFVRAAMVHERLATTANIFAFILAVLITVGLGRRRARIISEREGGASSAQSSSPAVASGSEVVSPIRKLLLGSGVAALVLLIIFCGRPVAPEQAAGEITRAPVNVALDTPTPDEQTPPALQRADIVAGVSEFERTFKSVGFAGTSARSSECYEAMLPAIDHADRPWSAIDRCMAFDIAADQFAQNLVNMGVSGGASSDAYFGQSLAVQSGRTYISHGIARDVLIERIKLMGPMVSETRGTTTITLGDVDRALNTAISEANRSTDPSASSTPIQADAGLSSGGFIGGSGGNAGSTYGRDQLVSGYTRANGTVVQSYHRTAPDSTLYNNYSTRGNINPYTGQSGHVGARH